MRILQRYKELGADFKPENVIIKNSLRINTLKIKEETLIQRLKEKKVLLQKIHFLKHGYYYKANFSLGSTPEYLQGFYYLQEAASQLPVEALNPQQGELVLDMAAAPGSKTTQIAQWMNNKGLIVALDSDNNRLTSLQNNLERLSVTNVAIIKKDARFVEDLGLKFDKILLDAPCSGNFCIEPDFFKKRAVRDFEDRAKLQLQLLNAAYSVLKKGGVLVYSTCSLEPEENEFNVDEFLRQHSDMKLDDTGLKIGDSGITKIFEKQLNSDINKTKRLWPHKTSTQGFFIAKMVKK